MQEIAAIEAYPTSKAAYTSLKDFKRITGEPVGLSPANMQPQKVLQLLARVTGKIENLKLKRRERSCTK